MAVTAARVSGRPSMPANTYLHKAPASPHRKITITVLKGCFRALQAGLQNSVNATSKGGAIQNLNPSCITIGDKMAIVKTHTIILIKSPDLGSGAGVYISLGRMFSLVRIYSQKRASRVKETAQIG